MLLDPEPERPKLVHGLETSGRQSAPSPSPSGQSSDVVTFAVNESAGTLQVWLDGIPVQFSTSGNWTAVLGGQNLGSVPMSNVQLGDDSTNRTYAWYADDITISTVPLTP